MDNTERCAGCHNLVQQNEQWICQKTGLSVEDSTDCPEGMVNPMKYENCDFYQVELDEMGNKLIHVDGYLLTNGESSTDNPKETWRHVQYTYLYVMLSDVKSFAEISAYNKQYERDITEAAAMGIMTHYFSEPVVELPMSEVTQDTPCGYYVDCTNNNCTRKRI